MSDLVLTDAAGNIQPKPRPQNAQLGTKIVFWYNPRTQHILQGAPEQFEPIYGYEKRICNHAHEAETWSARLCAQDKRVAEMNDYERSEYEGPIRADIRKELTEKLRNASSPLNAALLQRALLELDKAEASAKTKRESYLHAEAYEHGK
jgi:hypothetical protein